MKTFKNESEVTRELMSQLKQRRLGVAIKHADRFTSDVPDISVTRQEKTVWLELKHVKRPGDIYKPLEFCDSASQMHQVAEMGGYFYVYHSQKSLLVPAKLIRDTFNVGLFTLCHQLPDHDLTYVVDFIYKKLYN